MAQMPSSSWTFEKVDPSASGSSGKISDLFRNEGLDPPGHLVANAPAATATLMAREVLQNSWDAAQELRGTIEEDLPPFEVDFSFKQADGKEKEELAEALGLRQLADHAVAVAADADERRNLGLGENDCLADLNSPAGLGYCVIVERGASGMYGPWLGAESRMYLAMLSIGYNDKPDGSGGTFGYGKAGLIRASHPRIVLAYSCFREHPGDQGVTRRLLGVTYWGRHKRDGETLNGFARFGRLQGDGTVKPYENDEADEVAWRLGLDVRSAEESTQLGTTFLVVDPSVEPAALATAVERNWWPALVDHEFTVAITGADGTNYECRPKKNEQLGAFIEAYEHITAGTVAGDVNARLVDLAPYRLPSGLAIPLGKLALVADPQGWSFPDEEGETGSLSLVALTREPRMIVEYYPPGRDISRRVPFVRGVFVASAEANVYLAATEPKAHDKWDDRVSDDVPSVATRCASDILRKIRGQVTQFQLDLRPPIDETAAVRLQRLDEKLAKLQTQRGSKPPPPPDGERPFSIHVDVSRKADGDGLILTGRVVVSIGNNVDDAIDEIVARLRFSLALDEDGRRGDEVPLKVTAPLGFDQLDGNSHQLQGLIDRDGRRFEITSAPYRADWTGDFLVQVEAVEGAVP